MPLAFCTWRDKPSSEGRTLPFLPSFASAVILHRTFWNDPNFWPTRLYERDPVVELSKQGTSVLLNLSASPYTIDKRNLRFDMLRAIAIKQQRPVVYVNQVGGDDNLIFDGASMAITADG